MTIPQFKNLYRSFRNEVKENGYSSALNKTANYIRSRVRFTGRVIRPTYQVPAIPLFSLLSDRWNVFNEEWDLLIILDGCRVDALKEVSDEYSFVNEVDARWSVGANSNEWLVNTFNETFLDEVSNTAYVTSNPQAITVFEKGLSNNHSGGRVRPAKRRLKRYSLNQPVESDDFYNFIPLYMPSEDYGNIGFPSPRAVTDNVIKIDRSSDPPPRIVAHFMPPHTPFIARMVDGEIELSDDIRNPRSFEAYLDNLRWALDEVALLLENVNRNKVVISADHGWAFRFRPVRGTHPIGGFAPDVRRVPWAKTTATDNGSYNPDISDKVEDSKSIPHEEALEALGYL